LSNIRRLGVVIVATHTSAAALTLQTMAPQRLNPEEVFEDSYTDAFKNQFELRPS
jgi:hypothetical protein